MKRIDTRSPEAVQDALAAKSLTSDDLEDDENIVRVFTTIARKHGGGRKAKEFAAMIARLRNSPKQWDAADLMTVLENAVKSYRRPRARFLGITRKDMFSEGSSFLFGQTKHGKCGIVAYGRFLADFHDEPPRRSRLLRRTVTQCLSSTGFLFRVKRCGDPTCARAYPHSVAEHDIKEERLCPDCKKGFDKAFGRDKPTADSP